MTRLFFSITIVTLFLACNPTSKLQDQDVRDIEDFDLLLKKVRMQYNMPAMAAAVIKSDYRF